MGFSASVFQDKFFILMPNPQCRGPGLDFGVWLLRKAGKRLRIPPYFLFAGNFLSGFSGEICSNWLTLLVTTLPPGELPTSIEHPPCPSRK